MMELSSAQHLHQEMATDSLENMLICNKAQQERKPRPQQEQALKCPRCDSTNTKFCYYNNYSLTQPRYFCKSCRRYWTNGGTLRNVPVGGGCRKNKRPSSSKRSSTSNSDHHLQPPPHHHLLLNSSSSDHHTTHNNNPLSNFSSQMSSYDNNDQYHHQPCSDLSLVFSRLQKQASCGGGYDQFDHHPIHAHEHNNNFPLLGNYSNGNSHFGNLMGLNNISTGGGHHGFLDGLKSNLLEQTQFQNNSTSFQNLYNGGFGSNGSNCSMSNMSGDQIMTIPYEDLGINSSFGTSKTAGLLLKQEEDNNIHQLKYDHNNNPRSQILWGGAAGFPWHHINANSSSINGHEVDHINNSNTIVDNADMMRENMNVFAAAAPVWQGLINSPLM